MEKFCDIYKVNFSKKIPGYSLYFHKNWWWGKTYIFNNGLKAWRRSFGFLSIEWFPKS